VLGVRGVFCALGRWIKQPRQLTNSRMMALYGHRLFGCRVPALPVLKYTGRALFSSLMSTRLEVVRK